MTKKIFRSTVAVGLAVLLASLVIIMGALYTYFGHVQEQQLRDELSIAAAAMESGDGEAYLSTLHSDNYRITWLRADGTVLYDTKADAAAMENHAQREEVRQALANGAGESSRYSATLLEKTLYYARRLPDGTVLRLSASRVTVGVLLLSMLPRHPGGHRRGPDPLRHCWPAACPAASPAPLNTPGSGAPPGKRRLRGAVAPAAPTGAPAAADRPSSCAALRRRSEEFEQITASMTEGLVLLDNGGTILSMNPAACAVFHTDAACVGQPLLTVERGSAVSHALQRCHGHRPRRDPYGARRPRVPVRHDPHPGRRRGGGRGAADLRRHRAGLRRAQPPRVHRQRLPRAEDPASGHHRQRRAAGERHGPARGCAPLRGPYPQRGPAPGDADQRHPPPV